MRLSSIALLWAALALGCGESNLSDGGPGPPVPSDSATIAFSHDGTLAIAPGTEVALEVRTDPPAQYAISFVLLGDALDASLDRTSVVAGVDGRASVTLRAPSTSTSFVLRATIKGGASVDLPVAVSDQGFGSLVVVPKYSGNRPVETWHAGVISGKTCASLSGILPEDPEGALTAQASKKESPIIEVAPVGPTLAVYLRSGHYLWGCTDELDLKPDEVETVEVHVVNKPIDASEMLLDASLEFAPEPMPLSTLLSESAAGFFAELGSTVPASTLLLEAMHSVTTDPAGFDLAATQNDWATAIETYFVDNQIDLVGPLSAYGTAGLASEPPVIIGQLEAIEDAPNHARFDLAKIGSAGVDSFAFVTSHVLTFEVDPDDVVHVGGAIQFLPGRYVAHVIEREALAQDLEAADMAAALDSIVMCDQLPLSGMTGCDEGCIASLCREGLAAMWNAALGAASVPKGKIVMQISGAAAFDDFAALTGFSGTWLGAVEHAAIQAKVSGHVEAVPVDPGPG